MSQAAREPGQQLATLDDYERRGGYLVLHPIVQLASDLSSDILAPTVSIVQIDTGEGSPDVYTSTFVKGGEAALTGYALIRIGTAAGVRWEPVVVEARSRDYVRVRAAGYVRQPNGELVGFSAHKEIDLEVEAEKERRQRRKKLADEAKGKPIDTDALEEYVASRVLQVREHMLSLAESKAINRVLRKLLSIRQSYPKALLAKCPFAVPRLVVRPGVTDPAIRGQVELEGRRAAAEAYGALPDSSSSTGTGIQQAAPQARPSHERSEAEEGSGGATANEQQAVRPADGAAPARSEVPPAASETKKRKHEPTVPDAPKTDPIFEDGPHKGERFSEVAETDPGYLRGLADGHRRKEVRELAAAWLQYYTPTLGGGG